MQQGARPGSERGMKPEEVRAAGRLGAELYSGTVANIEEAHLQIAGAALRHIPRSAPFDALQGTATRATYEIVRIAGTTIGHLASDLLERSGVGSSIQVGANGTSNHVIAALNAAVGDRLESEGNPLAIAMAVRLGGSDVPIERQVLGLAYPDATSRIAVFVHGLGETEMSWRMNAGPDSVSYGSRLASELGYTPVYLRYNTGRHISENGRELAGLLDQLASRWPSPEPVSEFLLVGHSMGGLVIRSGCHYGSAEERAFVPLVRNIFTLGSPHLGAPLARWAQFAGWALHKRKTPVPFGALLTERSAGIDDLRHGYLTDEDWTGCDSNTCRENHRRDVPLLKTANHYTVSATVAREPDSLVGQMVGDLLVQPASAHGRATRRRPEQHISFQPGTSHDLGGHHHLSLLNDEAVYDVIAGRLAAA